MLRTFSILLFLSLLFNSSCSKNSSISPIDSSGIFGSSPDVSDVVDESTPTISPHEQKAVIAEEILNLKEEYAESGSIEPEYKLEAEDMQALLSDDSLKEMPEIQELQNLL